jgi:DNA-binding MarR family transcriptional regulator
VAAKTSSTDDSAWAQLVALYTRVERALAKSLKHRHGLGLSEYRALCHLSSAQDGELRIQELADLVGLNESSVSRLVARLEDAALVRRDLCPDDGRGVYTVIIKEGRNRLATAQRSYEQALSAALDEAATDEELRPLLTTIRHRKLPVTEA